MVKLLVSGDYIKVVVPMVTIVAVTTVLRQKSNNLFIALNVRFSTYFHNRSKKNFLYKS